MKGNEDGAAEEDNNQDSDSQSSGLGTDGSELSDKTTKLSPEMNSALTALASKLCAICQILFQGGEVKILKYWESDGHQYTSELQHHPSLSSLRQSVDAGCPICKDVATFFDERFEIEPEVRDGVIDSGYTTCRIDSDRWCYMVEGLCFHFFFYDSNGQRVKPKFTDMDISFFPAESLGLGPEYLEDAAGAIHATSTPNIGLAQYWFNRCMDDCNCRDEARPRTLPTRLVEVKTHSGTSSNVKARLCEAEDVSADASYLTLSHCWGGHEIFTLTRDNLDVLKRDIPVHQLSLLFKDVLYVTSQLGIKYIWIDCLCILQDCQDDWAYEAAKMGDVYRYAKCNIAASGYEDGKTTLFKARTPIPLVNYPLYLNCVLIGDEKTVGRDIRTPFTGFYIKADSGEFYDTITRGPLNERGWVAQERALSPGILHFTPKQMWWQCNNHIASEGFPYIAIPWTLTKQLGPDGLRTLSAESRLEDVYASWNEFAGHYAGTELSHKSDRFPALTGIARAYGALTKDNLIAGFWEGDLIRSLAWSSSRRASQIPSTPLAPTWSWAYLCTGYTPECMYLDNADAATLLCTCRRIISDDPAFRSDLDYTSIEKSAVRGLEMTGLLRNLPVEIETLLKLPEWRERIATSNLRYDSVELEFFSAEDVANNAWHWQDPTHLLPLIDQGNRVSCLLLIEVPGAEHANTFRRLGMVNLWFKNEDFCKESLGMDNGSGKSNPITVFEGCGLQDFILI